MATKPSVPEELPQFPSPTPAPAELVEQAAALIQKYPECFWFRHPEARIRHVEDVRLVIQHLREYGGHKAWYDAQELQKCLSPLFKNKS
ncbi:MAG TPA: hypothetical protein VGE41_08115 [Verrucomicrobiae bacterium]